MEIGEQGRKGSSQELYELGSVYLYKYEIYTPIRWNDTAPPTPLALCGALQENGCRHEGVLSRYYSHLLFAPTSRRINKQSSHRLAVP